MALTLVDVIDDVKAMILHHVGDSLFPVLPGSRCGDSLDTLIGELTNMKRPRRLEHAKIIFQTYRQALRNVRALGATCRAWKSHVDVLWPKLYTIFFQLRRVVDQKIKLPVPTVHVDAAISTRWFEVATLLCAFYAEELPEANDLSSSSQLLFTQNITGGTYKYIGHRIPEEHVDRLSDLFVEVDIKHYASVTALIGRPQPHFFLHNRQVHKLFVWKHKGAILDDADMYQLVADKYGGSFGHARATLTAQAAQYYRLCEEEHKLAHASKKRKERSLEQLVSSVMVKIPRYQ